MNPDQQPINSMRDDDLDYSVIGRIDKIAIHLFKHDTQLDRIEAMLIELTKKKVRKPTVKNDFIIMKPEFISDEAWELYLKHRKQKKVAVTEHAYNLIVKKLTEWNDKGQDCNAILMQSVENGWTGLFEVKSDNKQSTLKPEHISATYKQFDPTAPTDKHLYEVDRFGDMK